MTDVKAGAGVEFLTFDRFCLSIAERTLKKDGVPVAVGSRALDMLIILVEHAGKVVSKEELLTRVWAGLHVDEGNLRVTITNLRKLLGRQDSGEHFIVNVPLLGYSFTAPVSRVSTGIANAKLDGGAGTVRLPRRIERAVGRKEELAELVDRVKRDRFITIIGPGGIGKTTTAVEIAHQLSAEFGESIVFVDFSAIEDPRLVPTVVVSAMGLPPAADPLGAVVRHLRGRRALLVADNCEHLIDALAGYLKILFDQTPHLHILATSREALRITGERVHTLAPLGVPPEGVDFDISTTLQFPAVHLLAECIRESSGQPVDANDAPILAAICRKLDGVPLAIEFAASRVSTFGLKEIAARLEGRLRLLGRGRRDAPSRHQTLEATLDWSYDLLDGRERAALRRLSVLVGFFSLATARRIAQLYSSDGEIDDAVVGLLEKSLVIGSYDDGTPRYRLLNVTRNYALEKLAESGERETIVRRLVDYLREEFAGPLGHGPELVPAADDVVAKQIGNIRFALEWLWTEQDDVALAVEFCSEAVPFLIALSLWEECERWSERALASLPEVLIGTRVEMRLQAALGMSLVYCDRNRMQGAFERSVEIAQALGETAKQVQILHHLHTAQMSHGQITSARQAASRLRDLLEPTKDRVKLAVVDSTLGMLNQVEGNMVEALRHCDQALGTFERLTAAELDQVDCHIFRQCRFVRANSLWQLGFIDRALEQVTTALHEAEATNFYSWVNGVIWGADLLSWCGRAEEVVELLARIEQRQEVSALKNLEPWLASTHAEALAQAGRPAESLALIEQTYSRSDALLCRLSKLVTKATALNMLGRSSVAMEFIEEAEVEAASLDQPAWAMLLLRQKGNAFVTLEGLESRNAEAAFRRCLELTNHGMALPLQLPPAVALASLMERQGRHAEGVAVLQPIVDGFAEGQSVPQLRAARILLRQLSQQGPLMVLPSRRHALMARRVRPRGTAS